VEESSSGREAASEFFFVSWKIYDQGGVIAAELCQA
jgi:hypothetical protein